MMLKIKCYCFKIEGKGWIFRFSEVLKKICFVLLKNIIISFVKVIMGI